MEINAKIGKTKEGCLSWNHTGVELTFVRRYPGRPGWYDDRLVFDPVDFMRLMNEGLQAIGGLSLELKVVRKK